MPPLELSEFKISRRSATPAALGKYPGRKQSWWFELWGIVHAVLKPRWTCASPAESGLAPMHSGSRRAPPGTATGQLATVHLLSILARYLHVLHVAVRLQVLGYPLHLVLSVPLLALDRSPSQNVHFIFKSTISCQVWPANMAHHHRRLESDSAAIFSPSVARIAASTARDWSYIDNWLASKFPSGPVPHFERNQDTLKALLALASHNEAADEERQLVSRAESEALAQLDESKAKADDNGASLRGKLLEAVEDELPQEGQAALDSLATMAVQAGIASPEPEDLGRKMVAMQKRIYEAETMKSRVEILQRYIQHDADRMQRLARGLESDDCKPAPELAKQNLEMQRKVKTMATQLPELQERVAALASSVGVPRPSIQDVARDEQDYLAVLTQKKQLDLQMAAFEGLPSDPDLARAELNALRSQLHGATSRRDEVFEGLVERESPVKRRYK